MAATRLQLYWDSRAPYPSSALMLAGAGLAAQHLAESFSTRPEAGVEFCGARDLVVRLRQLHQS
jgi:hypothetical protein